MPKLMKKQNQYGFTIIEIMVSLTIGLVVTWAITSLFTATHLTFKTQDNAARSSESGRYALNILSQHIRQAAFFEVTASSKAADFTSFLAIEQPSLIAVEGIRGCDHSSMNYGVAGWACLGSEAGVPDSILVAYQVRPTATALASGVTNLLAPVVGNPSIGTDCLGGDTNSSTVTANLKGAIAINYFYVDTAKKRLMCRGNASATPLAVADGIEDLQIQYGVNLDAQTSTSTISYLAAVDTINWKKVVSVRLCVQTRSMISGASKTGNAGVDYSSIVGTDCQGRQWKNTYSDGILRKAYWSTVVVRNQSPRVPL